MKSSKPLVTLMVCTYNQEAYIKEAVLGALEQTYSPIEIILSDDCSTDNTFSIMQDIVSNYDGPHHIILNKNDNNLGLIDHVNLLFSMANGELIIGSSGDDISLPNRVDATVAHYNKHAGQSILFHGNVIKIGPNGESLGQLNTKWGKQKPIDLVKTAASNELYIGASSAFTRKLLDSFPPILYKNAYEDLVWGFRAALTDSVIYIEEPLVKYRVDVGISWKLHELNSLTVSEHLEREKRKALIFRDVLRQRILDLDSIKNIPNEKAIRIQLEEKLTEIQIDTDLVDNQLLSLKHLFSSPKIYLKRLNHLRRLKRKIKSGN